MGMYTAFHFNVRMKKDLPSYVEETLSVMTGKTHSHIHQSSELAEIIGHDNLIHPLFKSERWYYMLKCDSYYFSDKNNRSFVYDAITNCYFLNIRCSFKNYGEEIKLFVSWITPYLEQHNGDFLGFCRYEKTEVPTLIYHPNTFIIPVIDEFLEEMNDEDREQIHIRTR